MAEREGSGEEIREFALGRNGVRQNEGTERGVGKGEG